MKRKRSSKTGMWTTRYTGYVARKASSLGHILVFIDGKDQPAILSAARFRKAGIDIGDEFCWRVSKKRRSDDMPCFVRDGLSKKTYASAEERERRIFDWLCAVVEYDENWKSRRR
jgi:hypothetical protein